MDRVKIRVDDPATVAPGPPADVGDGDFTLELWVRGTLAENAAGPQACGANLAWIYGNIVLDRDRYAQDRKFGLSFAAGVPIFGVSPEGAGDFTICGDTSVLDGTWRHLAVARRAADGWLWMWVDGVPVASEDGPDGLLSYPDDGVPGNFCGGPCTNSDPFIVIGAEKHDAGPDYPAFSGWVDEVRFSDTLRYAGTFTRPAAPFTPDARTVALWHFDEAAGDTILDSSPGGASGGMRRFGSGGTRPAGPEWSSETPFSAVDAPAVAAPTARPRLRAWPNPASGAVEFTLEGAAPPAAGGHETPPLALHDVAGRRVATLTGVRSGSTVRYRWNARDGDGRPGAPARVLFARVAAAPAPAVAVVVLR
uniref:LamG domain-containing protein n=1 Tax=Eiseniibacteriota bacterium TaxID=2212470 RepID=A0A832I2N5_UNCEI